MSEPPLTCMNALMATIVPLLVEHANRPFSVFGHSMGAMIAFELTRRLEAAGGPRPDQLFVSGHGAPSSPIDSSPSHLLPHAEFVERIRQFGGTPDDVFAHPELLDIFIPILRADITLLETYQRDPDAAVDCPIVALGGTDDKEVSLESLEAWRSHTRSAFDIHVFNGGHFYWQSDPDPMLNIINATLLSRSNLTQS